MRLIFDNPQVMRLDVFLTTAQPALTRSTAQRLIEEGIALVNGKAAKAGLKLKQDDVVEVVIPEPRELEVLPEDIPLDIFYEDSDLIVVNKPQGMVVHPSHGHYNGTLVNALLYHCKGQLSDINGVLRPGIVHRIDKDTSGLLVAAKNMEAHLSLAAQLAKHSMTRRYLAVVYNGFKETSGTIDLPIGRAITDRKKMAVNPRNGKRAVTHYTVLEQLGRFTLIEARLETGRTHQIRVHMTHIGNPLLGDTTYGTQKNTYDLKGQALHAKTLGFIHPTSKEYLEFNAEPPQYFVELLEELRNKV